MHAPFRSCQILGREPTAFRGDTNHLALALFRRRIARALKFRDPLYGRLRVGRILLTVNCICRTAARFCYAGRCPRPWPPEGQMGKWVEY